MDSLEESHDALGLVGAISLDHELRDSRFRWRVQTGDHHGEVSRENACAFKRHNPNAATQVVALAIWVAGIPDTLSNALRNRC